MKHIVVLLFASLLIASEAARILVLQPMGNKSNKNVFVPLIRELANRDHHVTFLTTSPTSEFESNPNIREILNPYISVQQFGYSFFESQMKKSSVSSTQKILNSLSPLARELTETTFNNEKLQQVVEEEFDVVMISQRFATVCYPYIWKLKVPFIFISPNVMIPGSGILMGDNEHSETIPHYFSSYTDRMTLYQRTINTLVVSFFSYFVVPRIEREVYSMAVERFPDLPPMEEISKNVSLIFTNSHPIFNYPRVLPPDVIEVAAMHCRPAQPLPQHIKDFVSGAADGFIIFAIGSIVSMQDMPKEVMDSFITVLSRIPQRVIWQWKGPKLDGISENILLLDWLPQQDLLGHQKCRAFITHGGLNSLQEAVYHGVPVLGLPFGTDQQLNLGMTIRQGYGIKLEWADISEDTLSNNLDELLNNTTYTCTAKRLQKLLRDQPQTPVDRAVFWTEHVIQHGGTTHLRLASRDLNMIQRFGIDVFAVLLAVVLAIVASCVGCLKVCCLRKSSKNSGKVKTS